jgi:hypothetical protein
MPNLVAGNVDRRWSPAPAFFVLKKDYWRNFNKKGLRHDQAH